MGLERDSDYILNALLAGGGCFGSKKWPKSVEAVSGKKSWRLGEMSGGTG